MKKTFVINFGCLWLLFFWTIFSSAQAATSQEFLDMNLTELMTMTVSSVSKKDETIANAPGAIYVITQEDIRRSGVTSIPEALRMAPGVQVNRMDANKWAISIRGFNGRFANKLLVLMDGRTIYTPLFAGVFWEIQDYPLEDIERIEVIRGGSGTLWGANAVNGVINIITKNAQDTQELLLTTGIGTEERGFLTLHYGNHIGDNIFYRIYGKTFSRDSGKSKNGKEGQDDWRMGRTGFRIDCKHTDTTTFSLHGDYYRGKLGEMVSVPDFSAPDYHLDIIEDVDVNGGNLFFRWQKEVSQSSNFDFHIYYDYTNRTEYAFKEQRNTIDFDLQHCFSLLEKHAILWGIGYRLTSDHLKQAALMIVPNKRQSDNLYSSFIQDEISFFDHHLRLIVGARLEHNDYTGYEIQPSIRSIFTSDSGHTFWAAWSRGIRTPSRYEQSVSFNQQVIPPGYLFPNAPASMVVMCGSSDYDAEEVESFEIGFRSQISKYLFLDFSLFYNNYDQMLSFTYSQPQPPDFNLLATLGNDVDGHGYGAEIACTFNVSSSWQLIGTYSYMTLNMDANESDSPVKTFFEEDLPRHQFSLRSNLNLADNLELDAWLRYVDAIKSYDIDSYFSLDLRLGWHLSETLELSITGQNLLDNHHLEYGESTLLNTEVTEVERSVYTKLSWTF